MYQHLILLYSSYNLGERIAYHKCYKKISDSVDFFTMYEKLKKQFNYTTLGFHHLQLDYDTWNSVIKYDAFFSDVVKVETIKEFKKDILDDTMPKALDIAKAILSRKRCTHLQLQKLVYFYWCEYMKKYGEDAFAEQFKAWTYGPVIPEVYDEFKANGKKQIKYGDYEKLIVFSRISKLKDYDKIVNVVDEVIDKYGKYGPYELVDKTHENGTPWDKTYYSSISEDKIIPKELICEYMNV